MRVRKPLALLTVSACAALGVAACGGDDDDSATQTPAPAQRHGDG